MATAQGFNLCCGICDNTYSTDGPLTPRSLPCGHTLCTECLGQHIIHKVTESTFRCPFCNQATHVECSGQEDYVTLAQRFPVNFMLADVIKQMESLKIQNTRDQLRIDWDSLKSSCQSMEHKLNDERRQLLQGLDLSVAQTTADINNSADKMIENFTAAVRADQESRHKELGELHETARGKVEEKFNKIKTVLNNPFKFLNTNKSLLSDIKISESTIKSKRNEINQLKKPLSDYLATPRLGGQESKITFKKSVNATENICFSVGSINLRDEQTAIEMGSGSLDEKTVRKSEVGNPASDNMELVRVTDRQQSLGTQDEQTMRKSVVGNPASDNMELVRVTDRQQSLGTQDEQTMRKSVVGNPASDNMELVRVTDRQQSLGTQDEQTMRKSVVGNPASDNMELVRVTDRQQSLGTQDEQTMRKSVVGNPASDNMELVRVTDRQQSLGTQDEQTMRKSVVGNPASDYMELVRVTDRQQSLDTQDEQTVRKYVVENPASDNMELVRVTDRQQSLGTQDEQTMRKSVVGNPASDNMELVRVTDRQQSLDTQDEQTVRKYVVENPASDNMKLVKVIKTDIDSLIGIDVLDVLGSLKIIVASYLKSCITCYNYEDGTQHCMYETSSKPRGLLTLRDGRVVVALADCKILFLTVNEEITVMKSVKTKKQYFMITQLTNSNLAVSVFRSNPGCVDILNLNCDVIQSISNLPTDPAYLTASRSGVVVVCSSDQSVSCVMSHQDWVTSRDTSRLKNAYGITCDRSGFIYVVDYDRDLVVQLSPSGEYLRDVITRQNGLLRPTAVCFHRDKLYITQHYGEIKIFTWTKIN